MVGSSSATDPDSSQCWSRSRTLPCKCFTSSTPTLSLCLISSCFTFGPLTVAWMVTKISISCFEIHQVFVWHGPLSVDGQFCQEMTDMICNCGQRFFSPYAKCPLWRLFEKSCQDWPDGVTKLIVPGYCSIAIICKDQVLPGLVSF